MSPSATSGPRTNPGLGNHGATDWLALLEVSNLVSAELLDQAVADSKHDPQAVAEWLIGHGCLTPRDLGLVQAESFGLPFVEPDDYRVNLENRTLLPEELARTHSAFPLFVMERVMTLAVSRPLDLTALDQIRLHAGCEVDQCLCSPRPLHHLIEWAYGGFGAPSPAEPSETLAWDDILKDVADAPAVKLVNVLLDQAAASHASDVHIDAEERALRVRFRIDGVLRQVPAPPKALLPALVSRIKVLAHMDIAETRRPQDGHFKLAIEREELDIRVSTLPSTNGEAVVLRLLYGGGHLLSLEELGLDTAGLKTFDRLVHLPHGMLLVTGPTGSGKTTTLYSALARLDRVQQSIITLEDPVEIRLQSVRQVAVNPKAGLTFQAGLRSILRQDPDVILVGEIRDLETAETALQAALTGHLVLATLHTNSAAGAVVRLIDMGAPDFLVASALVGVLAQRLCRRLCQHCARPADNPADLLKALPFVDADAFAGVRLMGARGCKRCGQTGYAGRIGFFELMVVTDDMRRAILSGTDESALVALARANNMRLLVEDGLEKVCAGITTAQELLRVAGRVEKLDRPLAGGPRRAAATVAAGATAGGAAGGSAARAPGRDPAANFDVGAYEQLLNRWLRPAGIAGG